MKSYEQKIKDYLECDGWDIEYIEKDDLDWWADEIWKLKSNWSPQGAEAYLTFLVDPMNEGNRKKGEGVWGLGCSKKHPLSREEAESCSTIAFGKSFKKQIMEFQLQMESLRTTE